MYINTSTTLAYKPTGEYGFERGAVWFTVAIGFWSGAEFIELSRQKHELTEERTEQMFMQPGEAGLPRAADMTKALLQTMIDDGQVTGTLEMVDPS